MTKHRVLISAYGCEPLKGSESGVGWNWVLQMAKNNELYVITRANNREIIEAHLPDNLKDNIHFFYYDTGKFIRRFKNRAKGLYFYYFCWQLGIIPTIKKLCRIYDFDYSIHLTFGSMWMPTFLSFFRVPFIWGPVGGGDCVPLPFIKAMPFPQRAIDRFRYLMNYTTALNPSILFKARRATAILARTQNTADAIPHRFRSKIKVVSETAMESHIFDCHKQENVTDTVRMIISGRLTPSKNILTAIRALQYIPSEKKYRLTIIGSGGEKAKIVREAEKLGVAHCLQFIGETTRENVLQELIHSDIYLFPSLREGGSWALMEAMAIGLPVVCLDWSGMKIITDDTSAIRLAVTNPQQMPKDMAAAICRLIDDSALRNQIGKAGRERIRTLFNWEAKGIFMERLLDELDKRNG